jgi:hypothetical protein
MSRDAAPASKTLSADVISIGKIDSNTSISRRVFIAASVIVMC